MTPIDKDIINTFHKNFAGIKDEPTVLYGTGEKTKLIIEHCPDYHFIGIMDRMKTGTCYGLPILSEEEIRGKAKYIIIICNISSTQAVYQRIASFSRQNDIIIYHMNGERLYEKSRKDLTDSLIIEKEFYMEEIKKHDIISFDLFDTLITRECLYPSDLFEIMGGKLSKAGIPQHDFASKRKAAENKAFLKYGSSYSLKEIYQIYSLENGQSNAVGETLLNMEFDLELECVRARADVAELLQFSKQYGKRIILVSDIYMGRGQIKMILEKCGIDQTCFEGIYLSNTLAKTKADGSLWEYIANKYRGNSLIHFGDNITSDLLNAKKAGIPAFPIYSGLHMAQILLGESWFQYENDLECRRVMGLLVAEVFNSPFLLDRQGKISVGSLERIGYCFFGPLVRFFLDKLYQDAGRKGQKILFLARDGWILKKIADRFYLDYGIPSEYILTSRRAISAATTLDGGDIDSAFAIFGNSASYTFEEFCHVIFGIRVGKDDPFYHTFIVDLNQDELLSHLKARYGKEIKNNALEQRMRYLSYLKDLNISTGQDLAIVNFVGSGITQHLFEKFGFGPNSEFYYFAITPFNVEANLSAAKIAYFQGGSIYTSCNNAVVEHTVLGECIFSSPESQFMELDSDCHPVFVDDGINHEYGKIKNCHDGIERYISRVHSLGMCFYDLPSEFINETYGLLFDSAVFHVSRDVREAFRMKDIVRSDKICRVWE